MSSIATDRACYSRFQPRTVRFVPEVLAMPCLHINDYSSEEVKSSWYTGREIQAIRRDIQATVDCLVQGKSINNDMLNASFCLVGVRAPSVAKSTRLKRKEIVDAVLDEVDLQYDNMDRLDHQRIALLSATISQSSRQRALEQALVLSLSLQTCRLSLQPDFSIRELTRTPRRIGLRPALVTRPSLRQRA